MAIQYQPDDRAFRHDIRVEPLIEPSPPKAKPVNSPCRRGAHQLRHSAIHHDEFKDFHPGNIDPSMSAQRRFVIGGMKIGHWFN